MNQIKINFLFSGDATQNITITHPDFQNLTPKEVVEKFNNKEFLTSLNGDEVATFHNGALIFIGTIEHLDVDVTIEDFELRTEEE